MTTWPTQANCKAFYGNPDVNGDGLPDRAWELDNLVRFVPPYDMVLAWDTTTKVSKIAAHKNCANAMQDCLKAIGQLYDTQQRELHGLHLYGGAYNFRLMRGSTRLSMHSYGCAIDLNPTGNPLGTPWSSGMIPMAVVGIFEGAGATWGGRWNDRPDCQHFQFASVR